MSSRDTILAAVRANLPKPRDLPEVPRFESDRPASLAAAFCEALQRMGGRVLEAGSPSDPLAPVRAELRNSRLVCSATPEIEGARDLAKVVDPNTLADVDHAVVRASFGVAETGSVLLADQDLKVNALAYLAQHLIVLLDPGAIVHNLHAAYARPELRERAYSAFHSLRNRGYRRRVGPGRPGRAIAVCPPGPKDRRSDGRSLTAYGLKSRLKGRVLR